MENQEQGMPPTPPAPETPTPQTSNSPEKNNEPDKLMAVLSYIGILVLVPLIVKKDDPFVKFHVKQGLVVFIVEVVGSVIGMTVILSLVSLIVWVICIILSIIGITNVLSGKMKELPIVGKYAEKFKF